MKPLVTTGHVAQLGFASFSIDHVLPASAAHMLLKRPEARGFTHELLAEGAEFECTRVSNMERAAGRPNVASSVHIVYALGATAPAFTWGGGK